MQTKPTLKLCKFLYALAQNNIFLIKNEHHKPSNHPKASFNFSIKILNFKHLNPYCKTCYLWHATGGLKLAALTKGPIWSSDKSNKQYHKLLQPCSGPLIGRAESKCPGARQSVGGPDGSAIKLSHSIWMLSALWGASGACRRHCMFFNIFKSLTKRSLPLFHTCSVYCWKIWKIILNKLSNKTLGARDCFAQGPGISLDRPGPDAYVLSTTCIKICITL